MDNILIKPTEKGLAAGFRNQVYNLIYPNNKWNALSSSLKELFAREYGFVSTMMMPVVAGLSALHYNTSEPMFKETAKEIIIKQIPGIADDYTLDTEQTINRFNSINYLFGKRQELNIDSKCGEGVVLPISCGKDSLLTLGLAKELDMDITAVYINDTVSPTENNLKQESVKQISNNYGINVEIIQNNIEKLNDFETWNKPQTCIGYAHMITGFCLIALPFLNSNASAVLLGNQQDMNFSFKTRQGFTGYAAYDQTTEARQKQERMLQKINKDYRILSVVEPLANIAEMKILFSRYPELAKYQISCDCLDASEEKRWCHSCNKCARLSLFMLANNFNPSIVGIRPLLEKGFRNYYVLFGMNPEIDRYEKTQEARDQQLLSFYMAYKNGVKGELIDLFKQRFLDEATAREDELRKRFFRVYETDLPPQIANRLKSIFREELGHLQ